MSEKYFNAYVDSAVGIIHENLSLILQLKAQLRVANELLNEKDGIINAQIADKDNTIASLTAQLTDFKNQSANTDELKKNAKYWEDSYHAMSNKVSHMETLTKQYSDLKSQYFTTSEELKLAKLKIEDLENAAKASKKVLNTKNNGRLEKIEEKPKVTLTDDF
jgi:chromosome segregation ATPase